MSQLLASDTYLLPDRPPIVNRETNPNRLFLIRVSSADAQDRSAHGQPPLLTIIIAVFLFVMIERLKNPNPVAVGKGNDYWPACYGRNGDSFWLDRDRIVGRASHFADNRVAVFAPAQRRLVRSATPRTIFVAAHDLSLVRHTRIGERRGSRVWKLATQSPQH